MPDVLIFADTMRSAEMRHEVPLGVPDPFFYLEVGGRRHVVVPSMEKPRIDELGLDADVHAYEEFGSDEIYKTAETRYEFWRELWPRVVQGLGAREVVVPGTFPVAIADVLREHGVAVRPDQPHFDERRRVKTEAEIEGIRRAQRAAEAGLEAGLDLLRRAAPENGGLAVDGKPLTCELVKAHVERVFGEHDCAADEFIVSRGPQTAVGHDMGSGPIRPGDVVLFDLWPRDRASGCYADMSRTFALGAPSEEIREYHRLVKEALDRSIAMIRPGVHGRDVYAMVCELFAEHGHPTGMHKPDGEVLENGFYHGLGHGVGLEVHEKPDMGRIGQPLVAGDVVTVEPGLYRKGHAGVRLEDLILVTEDGAENLTDFPYDLEL